METVSLSEMSFRVALMESQFGTHWPIGRRVYVPPRPSLLTAKPGKLHACDSPSRSSGPFSFAPIT